jgi:hypothetical protein
LERLRKRTKREVACLFNTPSHGQMEWAHKYLKTCNTMTKVTNYYLGLTGEKNIVYYNLHTNAKLFQISEKLWVISRVHPQD